jgi:hypothetical protein
LTSFFFERKISLLYEKLPLLRPGGEASSSAHTVAIYFDLELEAQQAVMKVERLVWADF